MKLRNPRDYLFILASTPRAGTSMLRSALDQHPQIDCFADVFHPAASICYPEIKGMSMSEKFSWMRRTSQKELTSWAVDLPGAFDTEESTAEFWLKFKFSRKTKIVYMMRRNAVRQSLSRYRATQMADAVDGQERLSHTPASETVQHQATTAHSSLSGDTEAEAKAEVEKIFIPLEEFHQHMVAREASELSFFSNYRLQRVCAVAYEDLLDDRGSELARIEGFLEVDPFPIEPQTLGTCDKSLEELIENYAEFFRYFSQTPYERWLHE